MNDYRCFIWDFDGTLYDTYERIVRAVRKGMAEMGLSDAGHDVMALAKTTLRQACVTLAGPERAEELLTRYFAHAEEEGEESMKPFPGCEEALREVINRGGVNYLYTHRDRKAIDALQQDGLMDLFRDFITWEAGFPDKPAPDAINWLIDQHYLDRSECVMVGDRLIDAQAGRNAGIKSALFDPDGFYSPEDADFFFTSLRDIPPALMDAAAVENPGEF